MPRIPARHSGLGHRSTPDGAPGDRGATLAPSVFIFSDVRLYREGLVLSLSRQASIEIVGAADTSRQGLSHAADLKPDVIILDVSNADSFELARSLRALLPDARIIAFAIHEIEQDVVACAAAGFAGYVRHDGSEADLMAAIDHAMCGELHCTPRIAGLLFRQLAAAAQGLAAAQPATLTKREHQILTLLAQGMSNKEIARKTEISSATVKNHVHNILEKLGVRRRGEAVAWLSALHSPDHPRLREAAG